VSLTAQAAPTSEALSRLLGYLDADPANPALLADTAAAALGDQQPGVADELLDRYEAVRPLPPGLLNLRGMIALADDRFEDAATVFESLLATAPSDPVLRFNLAYARSMLGDHQAVIDLIDNEVAAAAPRAVALKTHALHVLGDTEAAVAWGRPFAEALEGDADLMSALSVAALDNEDIELARAYAEKAGDTHEGLSTLGLLALGDQDLTQSTSLFDQALEVFPDSARALMGKGLTLMLSEQPDKAAPLIDRSAEIFVDHLGTWITAGWAYFAKGDMATARQRFEHALALDDTFAESHGALAVLDIVEGNIDSARRRADVALRLDRECLSAALARSLLLTADGKPEAGERVRRIAMNLPVGVGGQSINQAMARMGIQAPQRPAAPTEMARKAAAQKAAAQKPGPKDGRG
jgi:tetratricopeptide (TPR) repeat protein